MTAAACCGIIHFIMQVHNVLAPRGVTTVGEVTAQVLLLS